MVQNEDTGGLVGGQPRLPLVLVCAGDGSYFVPFHLDLEDTLVIEGLRCLGKDWWVKAAQLNSLLRTVARGASSQTLEPLSAYLSVLNAVRGLGVWCAGTCGRVGDPMAVAFAQSIDNSSHAPVFVAGLTHATTSRSRLTRLAIVVMPRDAASATEAGRYHVPYDTRLLPPKPSTLASSRTCVVLFCCSGGSQCVDARRAQVTAAIRCGLSCAPLCATSVSSATRPCLVCCLARPWCVTSRWALCSAAATSN